MPDERLLYPPAGPIAPTRDADRRPADALARQIPRLLKRDNRGYPFELPASRSTTLRHLRKKEKPRRQRGSLRLTGSSVRDPNRGARGKKVARGVKGTFAPPGASNKRAFRSTGVACTYNSQLGIRRVRRAGVTKIKKTAFGSAPDFRKSGSVSVWSAQAGKQLKSTEQCRSRTARNRGSPIQHRRPQSVRCQ